MRKCEPRWPWFAVVSGIGHERISDFRRRRRRSNLLFSSLSLGLLVPTGSCRLRRSTFVDDQQQQEEEEEEINEKKEENKKKVEKQALDENAEKNRRKIVHTQRRDKPPSKIV